MSITFKRYLYFSFYFERELKSARSISQTSSILFTVYGLRGNSTNRFVQGVRVLISQPLLYNPFLSFTSLYNLSYRPEPCCMFGIVINLSQWHYYCNDSQGTSFVLVNSCEINRFYLRPLFALILPGSCQTTWVRLPYCSLSALKLSTASHLKHLLNTYKVRNMLKRPIIIFKVLCTLRIKKLTKTCPLAF